MTKQIAQGAEAIITLKDSQILKHRIKKSYRLPLLDNKIRKQRTKRESKLLEKAAQFIPIPEIKKIDEKEQTITMQHIEGQKLSDHLDDLPNAQEVCKTIGKQIALLHNNDIIHGDLTTSNMILSGSPQNPSKKPTTPHSDLQHNNKLYFIDFGLGFTSKKPEDKAVDLHLIKQALEAKHFNHFQEFFNNVIESYTKTSNNPEQILNRLERVEKRGRYKSAT